MLMYKIVFTPTPTLARDNGNKERFVANGFTIGTRAVAEATLETLQIACHSLSGVYKIVDADYKLKD